MRTQQGELKARVATLTPGEFLEVPDYVAAVVARGCAVDMKLPVATHRLDRKDPHGPAIVVLLRSREDSLAKLYRDLKRGTP